MTDIILDLTGYKDRVGSRVEPGRYRVIVDDAELDKSKAGNQMINVWLRVQSGEFAGATLTDRLVITDKSLFRVVGFMQAIGLPTPKKRLKLNIALFINRVLDVDVEDGEPYNGRVKSEVRGYLRVAKAATPDGEPAADLDDLADEYVEPVEEYVAEAPVATNGAPRKAAPAPAPIPVSVPADDPEEVDLSTLDLG